MADNLVRSRFIPLTTQELVDLLCNEGTCANDETKLFREFAGILGSTFHHEFKEKLDELLDLYLPFNPDSDKRTFRTYGADELEKREQKFYETFQTIANAANFDRVTEREIDYAFKVDSELAINVYADLTDFETLMFFKRGDHTQEITTRRHVLLFRNVLKKRVLLDIFERVIMVIKFKPDYDKTKSTLKEDVITDKIYIKTFKNVPKPDLEMILPNSRVKMRGMDKFKIAVPLIIGILAILFSILTATKSRLSLIVLASFVVGLLGYIVKTYIGYKNAILSYIKTLITGLYFKNLNNNAGVMEYVVDEAEKQETKEALLGYWFVLNSEKPVSETHLDETVERWFARRDIFIDWEVRDALTKLERLGLLRRDEGNVWQALPLPDALRHLDYLWDNYFQYNAEKSAPCRET
jgi:hypothetical protein